MNLSKAVFIWTDKSAVVGLVNDKVVQRVAMEVLRDAKVNCPVDTGMLSNSLTAEQAYANEHQVSWLVGTNVYYAPFVEFGTVHSPVPPGNVREKGRRPFLGYALALAKGRYG